MSFRSLPFVVTASSSLNLFPAMASWNPRKTNILQLVIPKHHGAKLTDIPDDQLSEILPVAKKLANASGAENYNILQNNGRLAHQVVDHVRTRILLSGRNVEREC